MSRSRAWTSSSGLLERDREFEEIDQALEGAHAGNGRVLLVEGPQGIGKTALYDLARGRAQEREMITLSARGGELEGGFPYGVVRQLFEPALRDVSAPARRKLLTGAARLAASIVGGRDELPETGTATAGTAFALIHGLHWLTINLTQDAPVLIAVDDAHWADGPSLQFLLYLAKRLEGLPASAVIAARLGEASDGLDIARRLHTEAPQLRVVRPAPLSESAIARVLEAGLDQRPDDAFTAACGAATGGVPFLVHELIGALAEDGVMPTAANSPRVNRIGPPTVARNTVMRLGRMSASCVMLARAISVLAGDASLPRAARLAGLDEPHALEALDALIVAQVVRNGAPLEFLHPIVRAAIYDELSAGERSAFHRQAGGLLNAEGADIDAVAGHLLASEPTGSREVLEQLREAGALALARGAPENAIVYLSRALAEGCERELRAALTYDLATATRLAGRPEAVDHYREVHRLTKDPVLRNTAALELGGVLAVRGQWDTTIDVVDAALVDLGDLDPELSIRLERLRAGTEAYDVRLVDDFDRRLPILRDLVSRAGASARSLALLLAAVAAFRGGEAAEIMDLVDRGWDDGRVLQIEGEEWTPGQALGALLICDELERARRLANELLVTASARGSRLGYLVGTLYHGWIETREGQLDDAEADIRAALEPVRAHGLNWGLPSVLWFASDVIVERAQAADIAAVTEEVELGALAETLSGAFLLEIRGRVRHARGDVAAGIQGLRDAGEIYRALDVLNPNASSWRSVLALMLGSDGGAEAHALAEEELEDALRCGQPRAIGVSLRTLGLLERGAGGRRRLEQAVDALADSPARLEHARALVELGAAMRRGGERTDAREPLRAGLDLAVAAGAGRLTERALAELAASGANPRRLRMTGRDALTPSELRVARLAAAGQTNNQIAQALFITPKTVDTHLSHAYAKLGISSRRRLAAALERGAAQSQQAGGGA